MDRDSSATLFAPVAAYRVRRSTNTDTPLPPEEPMGENSPDGAIIDYVLPRAAQHVTISVYDPGASPGPSLFKSRSTPRHRFLISTNRRIGKRIRRPSAAAGMHRFVWDLREDSPLAATKIFRYPPCRTAPRAFRKGRSSCRVTTRSS